MFSCLEIVFSCNFEDPTTCKWTQDSSDDFNWVRHQGETTAISTGPSRDHSKGVGQCYILLAPPPPYFRYCHHHHKVLYLLSFYIKIILLIHFQKKNQGKISSQAQCKKNSQLGRQAYKFHLKKYFQPSSEKKIYFFYRCAKKNCILENPPPPSLF